MTAFILYRAFDADDQLLYVGVTGDLIERRRHHARDSHWAERAVRWTTENYDDWHAGLAAERQAIASEGPLHNVQGPERARRGVASRVTGHTLRNEGAPFDSYKVPLRRSGGVSGRGRALCSCGALSDELVSGAERKQWHRDHKAAIAAAVSA